MVGITAALLVGALGLFGGSLLGRANIALPGSEQTNVTENQGGGLLGLGGDMSSLLLLALVGLPMLQGFMGKGASSGGGGGDDDDTYIIINDDDDGGD